MRYINYFNNQMEYDEATLEYPNVSLIEENQTLIYKMQGDTPGGYPRGLRFESVGLASFFTIKNTAGATVTITNDNGDILTQFNDQTKNIDFTIHNDQPFWVTTDITEQSQFGDYSMGDYDSVQYFNIEATSNEWNVSGRLADLMAPGANTYIQMSTVQPQDFVKLLNVHNGNVDIDFSDTNYSDWTQIAM